MKAASPQLNHAAICRLLPHAGAMCLLEAVVAWDDQAIHCRAISHRDPENPLRNATGLPALAALEYGAQAMAVHGALLADTGPPKAGFLAAVRNLHVRRALLDDLDTDLDITARSVMSDRNSSIYDLEVATDGEPVLSARATVILQTEDTPT
ncbi:hypothetical protein [Thioalkalivibrio thiocyanoxidans]|uniref:hypothetical protein n=1 Tax=Thioalkalivibrio thiocyanoxidans TaxID=152475 RepID=UPI00037D1F6F|nr:hypothetical protein [Thioalkalivibrio thiocyanoxidans]